MTPPSGIVNHNICQLDGNESINSSLLSSEPSCPCCDNISDIESVNSDKDQDFDFGAAIPVLHSVSPLHPGMMCIYQR